LRYTKCSIDRKTAGCNKMPLSERAQHLALQLQG